MKVHHRAPWFGLMALFVASFIVVHGWSGDSPALWIDTLNDSRQVRECLEQNVCTLLGPETSIRGIYHAAGWIHFRTLLARAGLGLEAVHRLMQVLDALAVPLVALAGFRLGGRVLASVAGIFMIVVLGITGANRFALYNTSPLAFLGAVLLLVSLEAIEKPSWRSSAMPPLIAAVMAATHAVCAVLGASAVWVVALGRERRALRASMAALLFASVAFAFAPFGWIESVRFVLHHGTPARSTTAATFASSTSAIRAQPIAIWALVSIAAWIVALVARERRTRSAIRVVLALSIPLVLAFVVGLARGVNEAGGKYLVPIKAPAALGAAIAVVAVAACSARSVNLLLRRLGLVPPSLRRVARKGRAVVERVALFAAALCIVGYRSEPRRAPFASSLFSMRDLDAIAAVLKKEHAWSRADLAEHVRTPEREAVLLALLDEVEGGWVDPPGESHETSDDVDAILLELDRSELPNPLPSNWRVAHETAREAAIVVFTPTMIDWAHARMCVAETERCVDETMSFPEAGPNEWSVDHGSMLLRVPLRRPPPGMPHGEGHVFMPRLLGLCAGRVVDVPGPASRIEDGGRRAVLVPRDQGDPGELVVEWNVGSPECSGPFPRPIPPFFVEADEVTTRALSEPLLRREAALRESRR